MSSISKTLLAVAVGILVGGATYVMAAPADKSSPKLTPAAATTTTQAPDVKGPCDEAEHANDPRCTGSQQPEDQPNDDRNQVDTGQVGQNDDGPQHDVGDDNPGQHHHNSGPGSQNSGPGSSHSDDGPSHDVGDDRGGSGSDDSGFDDHGGSGQSGSDGSGSGHSGSDD